jgi:hypothetical protein
MDTKSLPPDTLNEIGVLRRREIEARILAPVITALAEEFGRERVVGIVRDVIVRVAREQGRELAGRMGGDSLGHFAAALEDWKKGDAYRALGIPEVGALLSCNRDFALIDGFNPGVRLTRTQTIMDSASHCDFRFVRTEEEG